jgi:hypothetical protein
MKRAVAVIAGLAALVAVASVVRAGAKSVWTTVVGSGYAWGQLGDARNSTPPTSPEYISCSVSNSGSGYYTYCFAMDAARTSAGCYSLDPVIANVALHLNSQSFLYFAYNVQTGLCTSIQVQGGSHQTPMTP